MFDPERMLGQFLMNGMSGKKKSRRRKKGSGSFGGLNKAALGVGAVGVAIAAYEHFSKQRQGGNAAPAPAPTPTPAYRPAAQTSHGATSAPPVGPPSAPPPPPAPTIAADATRRDQAKFLLQAMVAAANADGEIDAQERANILATVKGDGQDARAFIERAMAQPLALEAVIAGAREHGLIEATYTVSERAIEVDTDAERAYLQALAEGLGYQPKHED